ncbi:sulfate adenylyltransferase subunit CysN [Alphaproteobacteria bacterium]|nr:sulfate adenylyltransferase subunit CysN [Alphaproteobacteria bacterium]
MTLEISSKELINQFLEKQANLDTLRFITCGSVDDGKSTLIGRLLYEAGSILDDQLDALKADSRRHGTQGSEIDFALLVDGLAAEREQGITIDVAYRFFSTDQRKFIIADTPGHEQYTRNMATGASTVEVAVILVDVRHGLLEQTRRHSIICSSLGIKKVVLAVNKIDLVEYDKTVYQNIVEAFNEFAKALAFEEVAHIPISALRGDNVVARSSKMQWYHGPTLLGYLETIDVHSGARTQPMRFPVQWVNRPNLNFRGFSGTVANGTIGKGQAIKILPSLETASVKKIILFDQELIHAEAGRAVTIQLDREVDISRGDLIVAASEPCEVADQFEAKIFWMDSETSYAGREFTIKIGTSSVNARITKIKHAIDVNTGNNVPSKYLSLNDFAVITLKTDRPITFEPFSTVPGLGSFVMVNKITHHTAAAGMISFPLRRSTNIHKQKLEVDQNARNQLCGHPSKVIWFTGLSGSGKSTIANALEIKLFQMGIHTYTLDGDNVRHGLCNDLGFTNSDRVENIRRVAEVAKLMVDAGIVVLTAFISPFESERRMARDLFEKEEFFEVFVNTPPELAEKRDPKGLYKKARAGGLKNFTGIDSPYEPPSSPELVVFTANNSVEEIVREILDNIEFQNL